MGLRSGSTVCIPLLSSPPAFGCRGPTFDFLLSPFSGPTPLTPNIFQWGRPKAERPGPNTATDWARD
eukprot:scaffold282140_cov39-Tisochrysis_lutea.AAC.5